MQEPYGSLPSLNLQKAYQLRPCPGARGVRFRSPPPPPTAAPPLSTNGRSTEKTSASPAAPLPAAHSATTILSPAPWPAMPPAPIPPPPPPIQLPLRSTPFPLPPQAPPFLINPL